MTKWWSIVARGSFAYNLKGKLCEQFQVSVDYAPIKNTALRFAYKNYQVKTTYTNGLQQRPLQPENRFFTNAEYNTVGEKAKVGV